MAEKKTVLVRIKRQLAPDQKPYWEEFELTWRPFMNVIILLRDIAERPVTREGKVTTPVAFDANCLEEVCGACAMRINGKARQACSALVDQLEQPIRLEPLTKFPVVRDLFVDRSRMFENLKRMKAWVPIDGTYHLGEGPRIAPEVQQRAYPLSRCITCGNCLEVCPQVNERSDFVGAAIINQVRLFNLHPTGAMHKRERLDAVMGPGGVHDCANAQNCVKACPKGIPLVESISEVNRDAIRQAIFGWLFG
ncbi:MAG: succinate dehydrogenase iron-sulfur subunit [Acidobacteriia bacterium]|jgi:succinate dehydrogenase / fumarate reductase iron-sulfur subunit|nr:succinate dehydrogenase iron-sulfur subunit [Terriglobia bacterium]